MVKHISIENFKSIKHLEFEAKRVNIFIGEPNTGKSNILEALGSFTPDGELKDKIRFKKQDDIFHDNEVANKIRIIADELFSEFLHKNNNPIQHEVLKKITNDEENLYNTITRKRDGNFVVLSADSNPFRYYLFKHLESYSVEEKTYLLPVYGQNLFSILRMHKQIREMVAELLLQKGYRLNLRVNEKEIEIMREDNGVFISYPYQTLSDTLQRIIFYTAAIESNKNAVLLFEEPEANTFPFYTKELGERIAYDEANQYFIITHNPYFLMALVEKTPTIDLNVFITYMDDYQTKVHRIADEELSEVVDLNTSIFFNLDKFLAPA